MSLAVLVFVQAWIPSYALAVNSPAWSLSVEAAFYGSFPWLGAWISRLATHAVLLVAAVALLVSCLTVILVQDVLPGSAVLVSANEHPPRSFTIDLLRFSPALHLVDFLVGICLGVLTVRGRYLTDLNSGLCVGGGVLGLVLLVVLGAHIGFLWANGPLAVGCFALLIRGLAGMSEHHWLHRLLATPSLLVLGRASYALYILHLPVIDWSWQVAKLVLGPGIAPGWWFLTMTVPLLIGLSLAAWWLIEEPLRRRFGKRG
jgi:peptidoglycan/LPS O-acetylase OafA/YrhL